MGAIVGGVLGGIFAFLGSVLLWLRRKRNSLSRALGSGANAAGAGSAEDMAEKAPGDGGAGSGAGQYDTHAPELPYTPTVYGQRPANSGGADPYTIPGAAAAAYVPTTLMTHQPQQPTMDSFSQHGSGVSNATGDQGISTRSEGASNLPYALPNTSNSVSGSGSRAGGTLHPSGWSGRPELQT